MGGGRGDLLDGPPSARSSASASNMAVSRVYNQGGRAYLFVLSWLSYLLILALSLRSTLSGSAVSELTERTAEANETGQHQTMEPQDSDGSERKTQQHLCGRVRRKESDGEPQEPRDGRWAAREASRRSEGRWTHSLRSTTEAATTASEC